MTFISNSPDFKHKKTAGINRSLKTQKRQAFARRHLHIRFTFYILHFNTSGQ